MKRPEMVVLSDEQEKKQQTAKRDEIPSGSVIVDAHLGRDYVICIYRARGVSHLGGIVA